MTTGAALGSKLDETFTDCSDNLDVSDHLSKDLNTDHAIRTRTVVRMAKS